MPDYRRPWIPGGTFFLTVVLQDRRGNDLLTRHIDLLRSAITKVKKRHPFTIHAWVVLPDHMHFIISLPTGETNFSVRIRLIKTAFSKQLIDSEYRSPVRRRRQQRGIWQNRFWEHAIRDDDEFFAYMDYCHINPVKHGYVSRVIDWPYSTFHRLVAQGVYPEDWAYVSVVEVAGDE